MVGLGLAWCVVALPMLVGLSRLLGLDRSSSSMYAAQSVGLWLFLPVYVVVVVAAITRHRLLLAGAVVVCLVHAALIWPEVSGGNPAASDAATQSVTVATANLRAENTDPEATATAIAGIDADILFLVELTPEMLSTLEQHGALDRYDESVSNPQPGTAGAAIFSRFPFEWSGIEQIADRWWPTAVVLIDDTEVELLSVHTTQPLAGLPKLNHELAGVRVWARDADVAAIYAGDFNAGPSNSDFGALLDDSPLRGRAPIRRTRDGPHLAVGAHVPAVRADRPCPRLRRDRRRRRPGGHSAGQRPPRGGGSAPRPLSQRRGARGNLLS